MSASGMSARRRDLAAVTARGRETVLFSAPAVARRVKSLARAISAAPLKPAIAVPILAGAFVFAADLLRALAREGLDLPVEFVWLRVYGAGETPGAVMVLKAPGEIVRGQTVLLIDGVLDSGATLAKAKALLEERGAAAVITVVAVAKRRRGRAIAADHVGFDSGTEFLYGYGMDRAGTGRGFPDIRIGRKRGQKKSSSRSM